jgi:FkbM family methyltransferase
MTEPSTLPPIEAIFFRDFKNAYIPNILDEVYLKKVYQPLLAGKKFKTIALFGANIGLTAYYFKDYAQTVYAVEPSKQHLECLQKMIEFNKIKNIVVCPYAVAPENGTAKFYHNDNVTMFSLNKTVNKENDYEEVETVNFQEFMKRNNIDKIDFAEIDIEGGESKLFASESFKQVVPFLDAFVWEYHSWTEAPVNVLVNGIRDLGYEVRKMPAEATVFECVKV